MNTSDMTAYSRMCGATLARAHARQATESQLPPLGQSDAFDRAIAEFSAAYADQNERDYQALVDAVNFGPAAEFSNRFVNSAATSVVAPQVS